MDKDDRFASENFKAFESSHITTFVELLEITDRYTLVETDVFDYVEKIEVFDITYISEHIKILNYVDIDEAG